MKSWLRAIILRWLGLSTVLNDIKQLRQENDQLRVTEAGYVKVKNAKGKQNPFTFDTLWDIGKYGEIPDVNNDKELPEPFNKVIVSRANKTKTIREHSGYQPETDITSEPPTDSGVPDKNTK